ncbi:MAG: 2-hydroxyglutaryl-CoA dehydratase [Elusimicrobia bacterium]|nr:2-hydroxyglutaryl-CoA dehydratase [Elusimicrobiota bacterium]
MEERIIAGIDLGSGKTKVVLINQDKRMLAKSFVKTQANFSAVAENLLNSALEAAHAARKDLVYVATTGLGRNAVSFRDIGITDITSSAMGTYFLFPTADCILDIGAQSSRAIKLGEKGRVKAFKTNDKCAAGSGGFLEKAAKYLEVSLEKMGTLSLVATDPQKISSICAVLAESEIISHVSEGKKVEDIIRGVHDSLADKASALLRQVGLKEELAFVGGVANQEGMIAALQEKLGVKVNVPADPEYVCALGAALLGLARFRKSKCETAPQSSF